MRRNGFTLLEITIVVAIMGVIMMGGAVIFAASLQRREADDTNAKLQTLQQTLLDYRRSNNRIPCPADITQSINGVLTSYFGVEVIKTIGPGVTACAGSGVAGTPAMNFEDASNIVVAGMVPTKALNLPDDYAFDGWGRRILYAVDQRLTQANAFSTIPITDTTSRITVNDPAGQPRTTLAGYVLVSFGPDGHGAYPRVGGTTRISANLNTANTPSLTNCHCNTDGTSGTFTGTFYQCLPSQNPAYPDHTYDFDDVVVYATRKDLRSLTE